MGKIFDIGDSPPRKKIDKSRLNLQSPSIELFNDIARQTAEELAQPVKLDKRWNNRDKRDEEKLKRLSNGNKSTQLRKFYNELVMWVEKVQQQPGKFQEFLPFIKMLNAKVAYANGREHVDDKFVLLVSACLEQIKEGSEEDRKAFINMKLFLEAVLGFHKAVEK